MNPIDTEKDNLIRTSGRMAALLAETPDDKLFWKPSPSSRSIAEIVAHSALSLRNIVQQMRGIPFAAPSSAIANESFLEHDKGFTSRAQVEEYFSEKCNEYVQFLESLTMEDLERTVAMPFGLGDAPLSLFITMGTLHTMGHIGQIEYVQTQYGDHDWHMGF